MMRWQVNEVSIYSQLRWPPLIAAHQPGDRGVELPEADTSIATRPPKMFKVVLLNDDFTPMDFVVHVLQRFFSKSEMEATQIMLDVHQRGVGIAGVFSKEIAETKVHQVNQFARKNKYPLKCTMEEE